MKEILGTYYVRKGTAPVKFWCLCDDDHIVLKGRDRKSLQAVCASIRKTVCKKCKSKRCQEPSHLH